MILSFLRLDIEDVPAVPKRPSPSPHVVADVPAAGGVAMVLSEAAGTPLGSFAIALVILPEPPTRSVLCDHIVVVVVKAGCRTAGVRIQPPD